MDIEGLLEEQTPEYFVATLIHDKLKHKYDASIQKAVNKIKSSSDLTTKEKQEKFSELKKRCISCGKSGGTIFRQEGINLIAKCGHIDAPCNLNIHLQRAKYMPMNNAISILNTEINNKKTAIIQTKLNFLFGFTPESKTVTTFNQLKSELQKETQRQRNLPTTGGLHGGMSYNQYADTMVQDRSPGRRNRPGGIGGKELMAQGGLATLWPR